MTMKDRALHFEMNLIGAIYDGRVSSDGAEIAGDWKQSGVSYPLTLKRVVK
jgi:hypothetical protein